LLFRKIAEPKNIRHREIRLPRSLGAGDQPFFIKCFFFFRLGVKRGLLGFAAVVITTSDTIRALILVVAVLVAAVVIFIAFRGKGIKK